MDRKRIIYFSTLTLYCLGFLALYLLIYAKIGRAETFDEFEIVTRAQNLIYEEIPKPRTEPVNGTKIGQPSANEDNLQYEPMHEVPPALMSEAQAPADVERGAFYGAGSDLYVNPASAEPEVSTAPIGEGQDDSLKADRR